MLSLLLVACGQPSASSSATALQAATSTPAPTSPAEQVSPCKIVSTATGATASEIEQTHGVTGGLCLTTVAGAIVVQSQGQAAGDPRPGYSVCAPPAGHTGPYCGVGLGAGDDVFNTSYAANWTFYPFPAADVRELGLASPQDYICIGNAMHTWTFHLDTFTYTTGCNAPPPINGIALRLCDAFLYLGAGTTPPLYEEHGKAVACAMFGGTPVGVVAGNPVPGLVVCEPLAGASVVEASKYCGFASPPPEPNHWTFVPLPVAAGQVGSATFDTGAGTACVTVGAQSFTFTLATMSVTAGCAPGAAATPKP